MIEVVLPVPRRDDAVRPLARRPATLRGGRLGLLDGWGDRRPDGSFTMYPLMAAVDRVAAARWAVAEVVWRKKDRAGSPASAAQLAVMAGCTAVVTGICLSGGCTAGAVGDAAELERRGVPTVTLCQDNFVRLAVAYATALGYPDLPLLVYPAPVGGNLAEGATALVEDRAEVLVSALTGGG
ncbi:MAG: hypothetical protein GEV12_00055 [Micromonosporaceae bacterium]|nr:hypothetical protein [Micromonosporaceae bacterium]